MAPLLSTTVLDAVAPTSTSWDEIVSALSAINPDCSREEWIMCGMAIHANAAAIGEMEQGLAVWNTWSAKGAKYPGERDILTQWASFREDKGTRVQIGSLFHLARSNGWVRPMPDAASLFSPTETITPPAQVSASLTIAPPNINMRLLPEVLRVRAVEISDQVGCDPRCPFRGSCGGLWGTGRPDPAGVGPGVQGAADPVDHEHRGARGQEDPGVKAHVQGAGADRARGRATVCKGGVGL